MGALGNGDWRRLAIRLAGFTALVIALDLAIGTGLAALLPHVRTGQQIGAINNAIDAEADVVILGSSHAMRSYDDAALSRMLGVRVHNAGVDGRGILFARGLLALICQRHPPKLVVLDMAFSDRDPSSVYALAPWYGRAPTVDALLVGDDWRQRVKLLSRSFRMNGVALAIVANVFADPEEWGFAPLEGKLAETTSFDGTTQRPLARPGAFVEENLVELVREARRAGAQVAFSESPTYGDPRPADVRALYRRVAEREGVPMLEVANDELPGFGPALFRDRGHLNRDGAIAFTSVFGKRLAPLLVE
jgi:hypothetical protein